jgi:NADH:ubiquinone oxidoreductase subunit 3 (subunit A)
MTIYLTQYFSIFIYLILCTTISFLFFLISFIISIQKNDTEKLSAYECGFDPFDDARNVFNVRFYLVAILFIIFDLEISFLFPWCLVLGSISLFAYWAMLFFLILLTVGFIYEWKKGALEWD